MPPVSFDEFGERLLARMAERRVPDVMAEADRLGQRLVEGEIAGDGTADLGHLKGVGEPGDVVVALRVHEDLRLVLQTAECLRMQNAIAITLERRAPRIRILSHRPSPGVE